VEVVSVPRRRETLDVNQRHRGREADAFRDLRAIELA
jgi:hypothetical protein